MLVASILSEITDAVTSAIGDYGLYAVFLLMFVDAVLPAVEERHLVPALERRLDEMPADEDRPAEDEDLHAASASLPFTRQR